MLQKLIIQNYAIIEFVEIEFSGNLNIITGETGSGKSILIGALGLILGERADSSVLFNTSQKCIVEGVFYIKEQSEIIHELQKNDLDTGEEIVIRREVVSTGKSRAFINDTPVTLTQLKHFASLLVDLHQQFDTLELGESDFQRAVVDALAGHHTVLQHYQEIFTQYSTTRKELSSLKEKQSAADKELDYHKFLYNELEDAQWKDHEIEDLENELRLLSNAENIKSTLNKIYYELSEGDQPLVQQLKYLSHQLQTLLDFHPGIPDLVQRLQSTQIELQDIADEMDKVNSGIRFDENRIQLVQDRISLGYKLLKKHNVQTTSELLEIQSQLQQQLDEISDIGAGISQLEQDAAKQLSHVQQLSETLSVNRKKQIKPFEKKIETLLARVGMPNARLKISITPASLCPTGADNIDFLFDANKSNRFEPLRKVASGGELSRLMLCIKSLVAASMHLPTLIFDEIDSGISGEAAKQAGIIMKALGESHQVIAITHQPQIAAKADTHFFVYKKENDRKINTRIKLLTEEERVDTIAQMLSGEKPTASALENAREMMNLKN